MKNAWFFGDSYTQCCGTRKGEPYYDKRKKTFIELVSEEFGYQPINKGIQGASNEWIIHSLLREFQYMKPNDIVVVSDTLPWGFIQYHNDREMMVSINDHYVEENKWLYNSPEEKQTIVNYVNTRKDYRKHFIKHYEEDYRNLINLFRGNKIHGYFWSHQLWWDNKLEKIDEATNSEIPDIHFSYKGHEQLADILIKEIRKDLPDYKKSII